jgi:hypothetical protein
MRKLFDRQNDLMLGGANLTAFKAYAAVLQMDTPRQGRSINMGMKFKFRAVAAS